MNNDMIELWGRWALATAKGQQHANLMGDWFQSGMQAMERLNTAIMQFWGGAKPAPGISYSTPLPKEEAWKPAWEPLLQLQQQFWDLLPASMNYRDIAKRLGELEQQVAVHSRTLDLLKSRLNVDAPGEQTDEFARQFRELIERQNLQFQQLTSSFTDYFKEVRKSGGTRED